jgi:hypothetical protein
VNFSWQESVTAQARDWCQEAIGLLVYPLAQLWDVDVTVEGVAEPPCPGHSDYMCTTMTTPNAAIISLRLGIEDPSHPANAGLPDPTSQTHDFFMEAFAHEIGHVVSGHYLNDLARSNLVGLFTRGTEQGTLDNWNPLDQPWGDRINEAVAETFKVTFLPADARVYGNRTNWTISAAGMASLMTLLGYPQAAKPPTNIITWGGRTWANSAQWLRRDDPELPMPSEGPIEEPRAYPDAYRYGQPIYSYEQIGQNSGLSFTQWGTQLDVYFADRHAPEQTVLIVTDLTDVPHTDISVHILSPPESGSEFEQWFDGVGVEHSWTFIETWNDARDPAGGIDMPVNAVPGLYDYWASTQDPDSGGWMGLFGNPFYPPLQVVPFHWTLPSRAPSPDPTGPQIYYMQVNANMFLPTGEALRRPDVYFPVPEPPRTTIAVGGGSSAVTRLGGLGF